MRPRSKHFRRLAQAGRLYPEMERREQRIHARNTLLITRYWWLTEVCHLSIGYSIEMMGACEFFLDYRTITGLIVSGEALLKELRAKKPTAKELEELYPSFAWR